MLRAVNPVPDGKRFALQFLLFGKSPPQCGRQRIH